jgi:hypothetical protein
MGAIKDTVIHDANDLVLLKEEKEIDELIEKFNQKYGTLVYLGVLKSYD